MGPEAFDLHPVRLWTVPRGEKGTPLGGWGWGGGLHLLLAGEDGLHHEHLFSIKLVCGGWWLTHVCRNMDSRIARGAETSKTFLCHSCSTRSAETWAPHHKTLHNTRGRCFKDLFKPELSLNSHYSYILQFLMYIDLFDSNPLLSCVPQQYLF